MGGAPGLADGLPHPPEPVEGPGPPGEHAAAAPHQPRPHVGVGVAGGQAPRHQPRAQIAVVGDAEIQYNLHSTFAAGLPGGPRSVYRKIFGKFQKKFQQQKILEL